MIIGGWEEDSVWFSSNNTSSQGIQVIYAGIGNIDLILTNYGQCLVCCIRLKDSSQAGRRWGLVRNDIHSFEAHLLDPVRRDQPLHIIARHQPEKVSLTGWIINARFAGIEAWLGEAGPTGCWGYLGNRCRVKQRRSGSRLVAGRRADISDNRWVANRGLCGCDAEMD